MVTPLRFALLLAATAFLVILGNVVEAKANNDVDVASSPLERRVLTQDRHGKKGKKGKKGKGKSAESWASNESGQCCHEYFFEDSFYISRIIIKEFLFLKLWPNVY